MKSCRITLAVGLKSSLSISNLDRPRATRAAHEHHLGTLKKKKILVLVSPGLIKATSLGLEIRKKLVQESRIKCPEEVVRQQGGVRNLHNCQEFTLSEDAHISFS